MGSEAIIVFLIAGIVLVAGANFLSNLISHKSDNPQKKRETPLQNRGLQD